MLQAEQMPRFVGGCFGDVFRVAAQVVSEDISHIRCGVVKSANKRDSSGRSSIPIRVTTANSHNGNNAVVFVPGIDRRDIDVEGRVVLSHAGPDLIDCGQFSGTERRWIAVLVKRGSNDVGMRTPYG